jgi:hypothetical protein
MTTPTMEESKDPLIQLYRAVEEAISIAGSNAVSDHGLMLDTAELELNLAIKKEGGGGIEIKAFALEASAKKASESTHVYKLKLRRGPKPYVLGSPPSLEIAETILALAKATASVAERAKHFDVEEAVVTIDLSQSTEGGLKFGVGVHGGSQTIGRITLSFRKKRKEAA